VMTESIAVEQLESVQYLYLREVSEPRENSLKLLVEEAVVNSTRTAKIRAGSLLALERSMARAHRSDHISC